MVRGLGRVHRFSNMSDRDWTVLDHSLHVHRILREASAPRAARRKGLGHDLAEAVMGDLATPIKGRCPQYKVEEKRLMAECIAPRFGLYTTTEEDLLVKWADRQALFAEAVVCLGMTQDETEDWGCAYTKADLPWTRILDMASDLEAKYIQANFRNTAHGTFLYLAEREGFSL